MIENASNIESRKTLETGQQIEKENNSRKTFG
jgi:hypothetical protein